MAYDNPRSVCHCVGSVTDFAAGAGPYFYNFGGPKGKKGQLIDIVVATEEIFDCDTLAAVVEVGTIADPNAYGSLTIADETADNTVVNSTDDSDAVIAPAIAADTLVVVKATEGTSSGTVTGQGRIYLFIDWY